MIPGKKNEMPTGAPVSLCDIYQPSSQCALLVNSTSNEIIHVFSCIPKHNDVNNGIVINSFIKSCFHKIKTVEA